MASDLESDSRILNHEFLENPNYFQTDFKCRYFFPGCDSPTSRWIMASMSVVLCHCPGTRKSSISRSLTVRSSPGSSLSRATTESPPILLTFIRGVCTENKLWEVAAACLTSSRNVTSPPHTHTIASRRSMVTNENILSSTIFFTYQLIGAEFVA